MPGITSVGGLASGLDTDAIIAKLLEIQDRQVARLTERQAMRTTRLSSWTGLQTSVFTLRTTALALNAESTWKSIRTTSSDPDAIDVSATSAAAAGTHTLRVNRLAQAHQIASQGFADTGITSTGTGTLTVTVGSASYQVVIDSAHDTLAGVRDAINDADIGVRASIINSGSGSAPYQLILASENTGSAHALSVSGTLAGGTAPAFASTLGTATTGTWSGTASPASGGTYTGTGDKTYTFTVGTGGTIGAAPLTVNWSDGDGGTGTVTIDAGYTPGTAIAVDDGVTVSFAAGTLVSADTFTIDVTSPTIQAAQDAEIELGSAAGGGSPITVTRSTNVVSDLIEGLTLTLRETSTTPITVTAERDNEAIRDALLGFVNGYNALVDLARSQASYDPETRIAAPLLGDGGLIALKSGIRGLVTGVVPGIAGDLRALSSLGVMSLGDGQLAVNFGKLDDLLEQDFANVERVLRSVGSASDPDVEFRAYGEASLASAAGYAVAISRAAAQAVYNGTALTSPTTASPLVIGGSNNQLVVTVDGVTSGAISLAAGAYESGAALATELEARINADATLGENEVTVSWEDDGGGTGHLRVTSKRYGSDSNVVWRDVANPVYGALGLTNGGSAYGVDVAGTIGGEAATGEGRILTANEGNASTAGISLLVNITAAELAAQGADQGTVSFTRGLGDLVATWADHTTDATGGLISRRQVAIQRQISQIDAQVARVQQRTAAKRDSLLRTFSHMETVLSNLQGESARLTAAIAALPTRYGR